MRVKEQKVLGEQECREVVISGVDEAGKWCVFIGYTNVW